MLVIQVLILAILLLVIPFFVGGIFSVVESGRGRRMFQWISGQFLIWVGIELISVALILKQDGLNKAMVLFWCYIAAVICFALGTLICQRIRGIKLFVRSGKNMKKSSVLCRVLWGIFGVLLLCQFAGIVWHYYTTVSPEQGEPFYVTSPFTMWIAFLARNSGMRPQMVEQVALPIVFLCMSYGVFYLLGAKLFGKKREYQPLLLVLLSVVAIVGVLLYREFWADAWSPVQSETEIMMLVCVLIPYLIFLLVLFGKMLFGKKKG